MRQEAQLRGLLNETFLDSGETWRDWLGNRFEAYVSAGFADRHVEFWEWVWSLRPGVRPRPFVAIWPRGGGKSTSAELACVAIGDRHVRPYGIYVCGTQEQSDRHVQAVATVLERIGTERAVNRYGSSRGWRRNQLRTAGGFTLDALGLDTASRGIKIDENRPGLIILDDIDDAHDSPTIVKKKVKTLTSSILPAAAPNCATLFVQNRIHKDSIASQLADGRADYLVDRLVSGPHPAIMGLKTNRAYDESLGKVRSRIIGGVATWAGQSLLHCQQSIDDYGLSAFLQESQQEVDEIEGALWTKAMIKRRSDMPSLKRVVVGVDPSGGGNEIGIIIAGLGFDNHGYVLADYSKPGSAGSLAWGNAVAKGYADFKADRIVAEANFGGDMVKSNIKASNGSLPVKMVNAARGKAVRAEPIATLYEDGMVHHVGTFPELETEMTSWTPDSAWSPNRLDALVWCLHELMITRHEPTKTTAASFNSMG